MATGGRPVRPDLPNARLGLVSDDIFHLDALPKSILIVGGGYIACEFACILHGLGVEVTQYYRGAQILRGFDEEARGLIAEAMRTRGIDLHIGTDIVEIRPGESAPEAGDMGLPMQERAAAMAEGPDPRPAGPVRVKATNGDEKLFDAVVLRHRPRSQHQRHGARGDRRTSSAGAARSWSMPTARPRCPRSMPSAMSPTGST